MADPGDQWSGYGIDTTYLALVISVIMAFPLNSVERREERLLNQIDGFIREAVMALSPWAKAKSVRWSPVALVAAAEQGRQASQ